ncbi:MAG: hypothetical protein Q9190_006970 [Brigantiaea leucoxantha]
MDATIPVICECSQNALLDFATYTSGREIKKKWDDAALSLEFDVDALWGFYYSIYGVLCNDNIDRFRAYLQKWSDQEHQALAVEFYGPARRMPHGPRSFLYQYPIRLAGECLGRCIQIDWDSEIPESPRSANDLRSLMSSANPHGQLQTTFSDHDNESFTSPDPRESESESGDDDIYQSLLLRYRERQRFNQQRREMSAFVSGEEDDEGEVDNIGLERLQQNFEAHLNAQLGVGEAEGTVARTHGGEAGPVPSTWSNDTVVLAPPPPPSSSNRRRPQLLPSPIE